MASWAVRSLAAHKVERPVPPASDTRPRGANDRPQCGGAFVCGWVGEAPIAQAWFLAPLVLAG